MANTSTGPGGMGGGTRGPVDSTPGLPWWANKVPGTTSQADILTGNAPPGYQYDVVQKRYVPILGSPTDALSQRTKGQDLLSQLLGGAFGAGSGSSGISAQAASSPPPAVSMRSVQDVPAFSYDPAEAAKAAIAARIPTIEAPDTSAADAAMFAKAKDQVGLETGGSLTALRSALAARGLLGGGAEIKGTSNILTKGQGELGQTSRDMATHNAQRLDDFAKLGYQGAIEQRGQDITTSEGAANRSLDAAKTAYGGQLTQRGQDVSQAGAEFGGNVAQRGQDVSFANSASDRALAAQEANVSAQTTRRGQTLGALGPLISKLY